MEGGEWSSFNNVVCVNEEADFMAQLFRNPNEVEVGYGHHNHSNNFHNNDNNNNNNGEGGSYYSCDSTSNSQNLYCFSQESSYRSSQQEGTNNFNGYISDHQRRHHHHHHHHHHALQGAASNASSLPFDFLHCQMDSDDGLKPEMGGAKVKESPTEAVAEDKNSDSSENAKKRARALDVPRAGRRNVKAKKSHKLALGGDDEEENEAGVNGQCCSGESLDDDCSSKGTSAALNSSGKTRASRGSATDPQSLYARKRRERINERLRILQGLVPNGTKVDISTMLEEAVQYVKFLQLQIKLLSSDDMWMYAPIAYNGMSIGLDFNFNVPR